MEILPIKSEMKYPTVEGVTATVIGYVITSPSIYCSVLMGRRSKNSKAFPGCLCLPGGFLEPCKETLEECAVREYREETGICLEEFFPLRLVTVQSRPDRDPRGHVIDNVFSVCLGTNAPPSKADDDLESLEWVDIPRWSDGQSDYEKFDKMKWLKSFIQSLSMAFDHGDSLLTFISREWNLV